MAEKSTIAQFQELTQNINWCLCGMSVVELIMIICINAAPHNLNPEPINYGYIHTFTSIYLSLTLMNLYEIIRHQPKLVDYIYSSIKLNEPTNSETDKDSEGDSKEDENEDVEVDVNVDTEKPQSFDILIDFQLLLSFIEMIMNFYIQNYWSAMLWSMAWMICLFYRGINYKQFSLGYSRYHLICKKYCFYDVVDKDHDNIPIALVSFLCICVILIFIEPIYVKWYPLNAKHETLFGGYLFVVATFYLCSICTRYSYYRSFLIFQIVAGWLHSLVILSDTLNDVQGNSNIHHILGAMIWFILPFVIIICMMMHEHDIKCAMDKPETDKTDETV